MREEVQRILDTFDRQIAKEWQLIKSGANNWPYPPSMVDKQLFIRTYNFTIDEWKAIRGDLYFEQHDILEWWEKKLHLLEAINDHEP